MRVTAVKKAFGKHRVGEVFDLPDKTARAFILIGSLRAVESLDPGEEAGPARPTRRTYRRRDMQPED